MALLVDISGSMSSVKNGVWNLKLFLIESFIPSFDLSVAGIDKKSQFSLFSFAETEMKLQSTTSDLTSLRTAVKSISTSENGTDVNSALLSWKQEFTNRIAASNNPDHQIVLIFTDGKIGYLRRAKKAVDQLKDAGVRVILVLLTTSATRVSSIQSLASVASVPTQDNLLHVVGYNEKLAKKEGRSWLADRLIGAMCPRLLRIEVQA